MPIFERKNSCSSWIKAYLPIIFLFQFTYISFVNASFDKNCSMWFENSAVIIVSDIVRFFFASYITTCCFWLEFSFVFLLWFVFFFWFFLASLVITGRFVLALTKSRIQMSKKLRNAVPISYSLIAFVPSINSQCSDKSEFLTIFIYDRIAHLSNTVFFVFISVSTMILARNRCVHMVKTVQKSFCMLF